MKKASRIAAIAAIFFAASGDQAVAQVHTIIRPRMRVESPSSLAGIKPITSTRVTATGWGRDVDVPYINIPVVRGLDSLGCTPLTNGGAVNGKAVLLFRGTCTFVAKVQEAQAAGATIAIIVNNTSTPALMEMGGAGGSSLTIPAVMVTQADGIAMNNALRAGTPVNVTIVPHNFNNYTNDVAIGTRTSPLQHALAMPLSQVTAGTPAQYRCFTGARVANVGNTAVQSNIRIRATTSFTPASSSTSSVLRNDSVMLASAAFADSLVESPFGTPYFLNTLTSTGTVNTFYRTILPTAADQEPSNDTFSNHPMHITDSIFSKGRYDLAAGEPRVTVGYRVSGNTFPTGWGPLYYIQKGGYQAAKAQFTLSNGNASSPVLTPLVSTNVFLFQWRDGVVAADSVVQGGELIIRGIGTYTYTVADSSFDVFTVSLTDAFDGVSKVIVNNNSYYYLAVQAPNGIFVGCDGDVNYYSRMDATHTGTDGLSYDYAAPLTTTDLSVFASDTNNAIQTSFAMIPFPGADGSAFFIDSTSYYSQLGLVPAIPLHLSKELATASVRTTQSVFRQFEVFPNPATRELSIALDFGSVSQDCYISVADAFGREVIGIVEHKGITKATIPLSLAALTPGNYYVVVATRSATSVRKVTVTGN